MAGKIQQFLEGWKTCDFMGDLKIVNCANFVQISEQSQCSFSRQSQRVQKTSFLNEPCDLSESQGLNQHCTPQTDRGTEASTGSEIVSTTWFYDTQTNKPGGLSGAIFFRGATTVSWLHKKREEVPSATLRGLNSSNMTGTERIFHSKSHLEI